LNKSAHIISTIDIDITLKLNFNINSMGEAKRRKELGIPPRDKKLKNIIDEDRYIPWLPLTKTQMSKYPYAPVATMALGLILLLVDWTSFN